MTKPWTKYLVMIVCSIIVGGSILGGFYLYSGYKTQELKAKQDMQVKLHDCVGETETNYHTNWKAMCGALQRDDNCNLPPEFEERVTTERNGARDTCFKLFAWN